MRPFGIRICTFGADPIRARRPRPANVRRRPVGDLGLRSICRENQYEDRGPVPPTACGLPRPEPYRKPEDDDQRERYEAGSGCPLCAATATATATETPTRPTCTPSLTLRPRLRKTCAVKASEWSSKLGNSGFDRGSSPSAVPKQSISAMQDYARKTHAPR